MGLREAIDYQIVTPGELDRANRSTVRELLKLGFCDSRMDRVQVRLVLAGGAFGWQNYGADGHINVPALSLGRLRSILGYEKATLRDVLRHEYAHAVADTHRGLMHSRRFRSAFGASHASERPAKYDKAVHVTRYAATNSGEDFAEVFMKYLKHGGRLPQYLRRPGILAKWSFVRDLAEAISTGRRRW